MAKGDGHTPVNMGNISSLSIYKGELHWQGERVKTETKIAVWLQVFIVVNAAALFVNAVTSINREVCFYKDVRSCVVMSNATVPVTNRGNPLPQDQKPGG